MKLIGRHTECGELDRLVEAVCAGESRAIVLSGEAGVGKTALLDYVAKQASDCRVIRAAGVQSEMELPFAALHQVCAPALGNLERLPVPQRARQQLPGRCHDGHRPRQMILILGEVGCLGSETPQWCPMIPTKQTPPQRKHDGCATDTGKADQSCGTVEAARW
jgi:hypothetical protein